MTEISLTGHEESTQINKANPDPPRGQGLSDKNMLPDTLPLPIWDSYLDILQTRLL